MYDSWNNIKKYPGISKMWSGFFITFIITGDFKYLSKLLSRERIAAN